MRTRFTSIGIAVVALGSASIAASAPAPAPAAPSVANLIAPTAVTMKQGHARYLVGVKTKTQARVIVRVISVKTGKVMRTTKSVAGHAPGRVWLLIEATASDGSQLPAGRYRTEVYAVNAQKRRSNTITRRFTLTYRTPRGVIQAYTVPAWPSIIAGVAPAAGGQIVAALGKRAGGTPSTLEKAGVLVGDVIRSVNGTNVDQRGGWLVALRKLPAGTPVPLEIDRNGVRQTLQFTPPADWATALDYKAPLAASAAAHPGVLAYKYAGVRERLDAGDAAGATALYKTWTVPERTTAPGYLLEGHITAVTNPNGTPETAAIPFNQAFGADPTMAAARFALGVWRSSKIATDTATAPPTQRTRAITAFTEASTLDPTDALAPTFLAFVHLGADQFAEALAAAETGTARDPRYEEARVARAIALFGLGRTAEGVADLKRGLLLMDNPARAQRFITDFLEPNTK